MLRFGFLGAGNMAQAMMQGFMKKGILTPNQIYISDIDQEKCKAIEKDIGVHAMKDNLELVQTVDYITLAIKPNVCRTVLSEIQPVLSAKQSVFSIVTGWTHAMLLEHLGKDAHVLRLMPNTPAMVGEGVIALNQMHTLQADVFTWVQSAFSAFGRVLIAEERNFNAIIGLSGSGPAYGYVFIEAMADAGVRNGLPRELSYTLAAQTLLGAARMVLDTGMHPGELKDAVCSPAGTTIEAICALEKHGFRNAVIQAVQACVDQANKM